MVIIVKTKVEHSFYTNKFSHSVKVQSAHVILASFSCGNRLTWICHAVWQHDRTHEASAQYPAGVVCKGCFHTWWLVIKIKIIRLETELVCLSPFHPLQPLKYFKILFLNLR